MKTNVKKGDLIKIHYPTGDTFAKEVDKDECIDHSDSILIEILSSVDDPKVIDANGLEVKVGDTVFIVRDDKLLKGRVAYIHDGQVTVQTSIANLSTNNPKEKIVKVLW